MDRKKRIIGRYADQPQPFFPIDAETFVSIEDNIGLTAIIGNIAGDKAILCGCELNESKTSRGDGYVFLRTQDFPDGEVLYFEGGAVSDRVYVRNESVSFSAQGYDFSNAYTKRSLAPGTGEESYVWADFSAIETLPRLKAELLTLRGEFDKIAPQPIGSVQLFAGVACPAGWLLCNGQECLPSDYPELFNVLGTTYNCAVSAGGDRYTTTAGNFRVPDLRGRFVVGLHDTDADYRQLGAAGGEKTHTLTVDEMPGHSHGLFLQNSGTRFTGGGSANALDSGAGSTGIAGSGKAHENRPPYYALSYIIKAK